MDFPASLSQRFEIIETLSSPPGNDCGVWRAIERITGETVVLKITPYHLVPPEQILTHITRLHGDGAHITAPREWETIGTTDFLQVFGNFPAGSLAQRVEDIDAADLRRLVEHINLGLQALHSRDTKPAIIHCDLKPSNILIARGNGSPYTFFITDFDAAVIAGPTNRSTDIRRYTLRYAAPEIIRMGIARPASDYWSLGIIILECLLGHHPLATLDTNSVREIMLMGWSPPYREIEDARWRALCGGLLQNDPDLRWGFDELQAWLEEDPEIISQGLALIGEPAADTPFFVHGQPIYSAEGLTRALLRNWATEVIGEPSLFAWLRNDLGREDIATRLEQVRDDNRTDNDLALLRFFFSLDGDLPAIWRGHTLTEESFMAAAEAALSGDEDMLAWLHSLLDGRCGNIFAQLGQDRAADLIQSLISGWQEYQDAWDTVIDAGAPASTRPDEAHALPLVTGLIFSREQRDALRLEARAWFEPGPLLLREDWFLVFGTDLPDLPATQLAVLKNLADVALLSEYNANSIDELGDVDLEQLQNSVIQLESQRKLLDGFVVPAGESVTLLHPGSMFNSPHPQTPFEHIREWLYRLFYDRAPSVEDSDGDGETPQQPGEPEGTEQPDESVYPEETETGEEETEQADTPINVSTRIVRVLPGQNDEAFPVQLDTFLALISWRAEENMRVRLRLSSIGPLLRRTRLRTPILPPTGSIILMMHSDTVIRLAGRRRWYLPRYKTSPIVIRCRQNTALITPNRDLVPALRVLIPTTKKILPTNDRMVQSDTGLLKPPPNAMLPPQKKLTPPLTDFRQPLSLLPAPKARRRDRQLYCSLIQKIYGAKHG